MVTRRAFGLGLLAALTVTTSALADPPAPPGFVHTGTGTRVRSRAWVDVKLYDISHFMRTLPEKKTRQAVIESHCDKRFVLKFRMDVPADTAKDTLRAGFERNGFTDKDKIERFLSAFGTDGVKDGTRVVIHFDADADATSMTVGSLPAQTIAGVEFMRAVWSLWLGRSDQPKLGEQLVSRL